MTNGFQVINLRLFMVLAVTTAFVSVWTEAADPKGETKRRPDAKKAELETKLLTVPRNPVDAEWQRTWRKHLGMGFLYPEKESSVIALRIANRSPCEFEVTTTHKGLLKDGRRGDAPWRILPGKSLYAGTSPSLPTVPINNNLDGTPIFQLVTFFEPLCEIKVIPKHTDLKPLTLQVYCKLGADAQSRAVAANYYLCRPEDKETIKRMMSAK